MPTAWPALAAAEVEYGGQAVAIVAAESASIAADARALVQVAYTPRRAVAGIDEALAAGQLLVRRTGSHGEVEAVFAAAPLTFTETFTHGRCAAVPMEPRGVIADWDGDTLTLWASTQTPSMLRTALAGALGLTQSRVRVIVPDVGGGFGLKVHVFPEDVAVAAAARRLRRPVKWVEERQENLGATVHAREGRVTVDVAADRTGAGARPARARHLRRRRVPHLSADGGAGAARCRVHPARAVPDRGVRVGRAGGAHAQAPARRVPRSGHDDGRVRHGARHGPDGRARGARSRRGAPAAT